MLSMKLQPSLHSLPPWYIFSHNPRKRLFFYKLLLSCRIYLNHHLQSRGVVFSCQKVSQSSSVGRHLQVLFIYSQQIRRQLGKACLSGNCCGEINSTLVLISLRQTKTAAATLLNIEQDGAISKCCKKFCTLPACFNCCFTPINKRHAAAERFEVQMAFPPKHSKTRNI